MELKAEIKRLKMKVGNLENENLGMRETIDKFKAKEKMNQSVLDEQTGKIFRIGMAIQQTLKVWNEENK
ncbi:MAG: hypothetical protein GY822_14440 [Deltaproteobacteria bacterium]|nr:hypothetical protein [Deltaproteobacteria bacterium]